MATLSSKEAAAIHQLEHLAQESGGVVVHPSEEQLAGCLLARFRADLPYTRIGSSTLVVVNPLKALANLNDASASDYVQREYADSSPGAGGTMQPHLYELAGRVYLVMRRRVESQAVIFSGISGSGKTFSSELFVSQVLRLSSHSRKEIRVADQIRALSTLLESFGSAKTASNPAASRFGKLLELHFTDKGRIAGAQVLPFGLDKSRVTKLSREERTFNVFYQLLAGASPDERDALDLDEPSAYTLLASSGCYLLPGGPLSDDHAQMGELRAAMAALGFKPKHVSSIFSLLVAILLLGNLTFENDIDGLSYQSATVTNRLVLNEAANLLGLAAEELEEALTNKTKYVRKELASGFLTAEGAALQRDGLVRDLYAILFAYVVELANQKLYSTSHTMQITVFDQPGFQSRTPSGSTPASLIAAHGENGFEELCFNFSAEVLHSTFLQRAFDDSAGYSAAIISDKVSLPAVLAMDNSACLELLRGGAVGSRADRKPGGIFGAMAKGCSRFQQGKASEDKDEELLDDLTHKFGAHPLFVTEPNAGAPGHVGSSSRTLFGVKHYSGVCSYDVKGFLDKDLDVLDSSLVTLLRKSADPFVGKLVSGPSLATEVHPQDQRSVVQAQVSITPFRRPTPVTPLPSALSIAPAVPEPILEQGEIYPVSTQLNATLAELLTSLQLSRTWDVLCIRPNDNSLPNSFDKRRVREQIRSYLLPDLVKRRASEFIADFEFADFVTRYGIEPASDSDGVEATVKAFATGRSWTEGLDFAVGEHRVWLSYDTWREVEDDLREEEKRLGGGNGTVEDDHEVLLPERGEGVPNSPTTPWTGRSGGGGVNEVGESTDDLLLKRTTTTGTGYHEASGDQGGYKQAGYASSWVEPERWNNNRPSSPLGSFAPPQVVDATDGTFGDKSKSDPTNDGLLVKEKGNIEIEEINGSRRWWVRFVWFLTFWVPNFALIKFGRMKRPDVRMAWREKLAICMLIFFLCGVVIFYVVIFGRLLCPRFDDAWNTSELTEHAQSNTYYSAIAGKVYDFTNFWQGQHSDVSAYPVTHEMMLELAGTDLTNYFPIPFNIACPGLVTDETLTLTKNFTAVADYAVHYSGKQQPYGSTALQDDQWYPNKFLPYIKDYYKGTFVFSKKDIRGQADSGAKTWAIYKDGVYDLSDYFATITAQGSSSDGAAAYSFLDDTVTSLWQNTPGQDITKGVEKALAKMNETYADQQYTCLRNAFYLGDVDFRESPRCTANNYILLSFSVLIMLTILVKFLAALQLTGKRNPEMLDKFVICQIPCYTEGEESLRKTIDSLAALNYDDKRKLLFVICDGNIIGSGNDKTTPRIVLDILGVDPKLDPEPLLFKSVGEGSKQLNYGKIYSGLYEFEGHIVPYMVAVKVGRPSERSKPGNRGKRDSQILLLRYLNRVHFDAPMAPLELEIYHQMRNVIGIDPAFYEYLFQVDADTCVAPDSLNRMIACTIDDQSIIGICGETKLQNETQSFTTMIQVYEYFISHHLAKAFESLFGSVTCLPGCFSVYRLRTADKGRPIIISQRIIDDYSENNVDTLHKKNLFSLGEDRYLTTLMMKYFPSYKMKFTPDAIAYTVAPESWSVLLSQRRRWINSTIHNLAELYFLPDLCGFCIFSMRFIVMLDLVGTLILPATCVYLFYLIITVAIGQAPVPIIALAMIGAVYGLQAIIFLVKREFMLIGWMVIYILAFPIYSFFLPVYSFWSMDDFSWGNTRVVLGEGKDKKVITSEGEHFDDSMIPLKKFSDYEAEAWEYNSRHDSGSIAGTDYGSRPVSIRDEKRSMMNRSPRPPPSNYGGSQAGEFSYYRDTSPLHHHNSSSNLRQSNLINSRMPSMASGFGQVPPYGAPPGFNPMAAGGFGASSEYSPPLYPPQFPGLGPRLSMMSGGGPPSLFGGANSMLSGFPDMSAPAPGGGLHDPRMSAFSLATTANPFASAAPSESTNPTDEEVLDELRHYLSSQDLMNVTKKTTRTALFARFPKADLTGRIPWINSSIDGILQGSL